MSDMLQLERKTIETFKAFEPEDGYYLAYSGGKDSDCIKILAQLAGVKFEAVHNLTTVDAPETVQYIKSQSDVRIDLAHDKNSKPITMWNLIVKKGLPPTRLIRYCCSELKERGGNGKLTVTGVRKAESIKRNESSSLVKIIGKPVDTLKKAEEYGADYNVSRQGGVLFNNDNDASRRTVEYCYRTRKSILNPIVDWSDSDVWEFLRHYGCKSNPLYECGVKRIGCIGCPNAGSEGQLKQFALYPKYKQNYINTFSRMLKSREERGLNNYSWKSGLDVFDWWTGYDSNQIRLDDYEVNDILSESNLIPKGGI